MDTEIKEDVQEECSKYGTILDIKIPRPAGVRSTVGVGKIYIKYENTAAAQKAITSLAGRQFSRRTVVVTEFSEESFDVDAW
jgi:splicing factor U2AF subunit